MKTSTAALILRTAYLLTLLLMPAVYARAQMRVVAVADSHGAYPEFVAILQRVGLMDGNRQWIGGSSVLIDAGMLKEVYGGRASALEFRDGSVTAYYADGEPQVLVGPAGGATASASSHDKSGGKPES